MNRAKEIEGFFVNENYTVERGPLKKSNSQKRLNTKALSLVKPPKVCDIFLSAKGFTGKHRYLIVVGIVERD